MTDPTDIPPTPPNAVPPNAVPLPGAMAAPAGPTPGERRRAGLRASRWVIGGVAVGATAFLTGTIAGISAADTPTADVGVTADQSAAGVTADQSAVGVFGNGERVRTARFDRDDDDRDDDDRDDDDRDDDEYRRARPSAPRSVPMGGAWNRAGTGVAPGTRAVPGNPSADGTNPSSQSRAPQTRSRGS